MENSIMQYITWDNFKVLLWILFGSGIFFELSPIKFNPISSILKWVGKRLNKDVEDKFNSIEKKVDVIQHDLQDHKVEGWRRDIKSFSEELRTGSEKRKDQFDETIALYDKYEKYIEERGMKNGEIDAAMKFIRMKYDEHMENNSFYTGK
jgi:hypothetical protein